MTDDLLFDVPHSEPSALDKARMRFVAAKAEYDLDDAWTDETGEEIPGEIVREYRAASRALLIEEEAEVKRRAGH